MPFFQKFSITLDPTKITSLSKSAHAVSTDKSKLGDDVYSDDSIQTRTFAETLNVIQQAKLIQNPEQAKYVVTQADEKDRYIDSFGETKESVGNIYVKIDKISSNKQEVAENYQEISMKDASRLNNLEFIIGDEVINTNADEKFLEKVAQKYNVVTFKIALN